LDESRALSVKIRAHAAPAMSSVQFEAKAVTETKPVLTTWSLFKIPVCRSRPVIAYPNSELRPRALKRGELFFSGTPGSCDCLVWDINRDGAMIQVDPDATPPDRFRLVSGGLFLNQLCEVIWRNGQSIGVKFDT
jgi:hypothetical protein